MTKKPTKTQRPGGELKPNSPPLGVVEKLFLFKRIRDNKLIPMSEKHAVTFGQAKSLSGDRVFEYLGYYEGADPEIGNKTVKQIKAMNLPKLEPVDRRKTIIYKGREITFDEFVHITGRPLRL